MIRKFRRFWTVIETLPSQEERAACSAERLECEIYLPRFRVLRSHRGGRLVAHREILFPEYLFVRITEDWQSLSRARGVRRVLIRADLPIRIRDEEVESIRVREDSEGLVRLRPRLESGDSVVVGLGGGAYSGVSGFVEDASAQERVRVLFRMMGRAVRVEFDESALAKAA